MEQKLIILLSISLFVLSTYNILDFLLPHPTITLTDPQQECVDTRLTLLPYLIQHARIINEEITVANNNEDYQTRDEKLEEFRTIRDRIRKEVKLIPILDIIPVEVNPYLE